MGQQHVHSALLLVLVSCTTAQYIVEVLEPPRLGLRRTVQRCDATGANFGVDVVPFVFGPMSTGCALSVTPEDACKPVTMNRVNDTTCLVNFAIVPRGNCNFSEKAYFVQDASPRAFDALIVYNHEGQGPVEMAGGKNADKVRIPVIMVSYNCMVGMMERYTASEGYAVQIKLSPGYYDLFRYLIPFVVVIGFCFIVLLASLLIRLYRERRRLARKRLSRRHLKKLPVKKFVRGDQPDTCAICLDEFIEGEKLRVLPCRHMYHCKCIDPWLTNNRKVCPMCKRRVGAKNSDSDSSGDERARRAVAARVAAANNVLFNTRSVPYRVLDEHDEGASATSSRVDLSPSSSNMMLTPSTSSHILTEADVHQQPGSEQSQGLEHASTEHTSEHRPAAVTDSEDDRPPSIYYYEQSEDDDLDDDQRRLQDAGEEDEAAAGVDGNAPAGTLRRAIRSFVGRLTTSSSRMQNDIDWEGGVDNAAFEENQRTSRSIDEYADDEAEAAPSAPSITHSLPAPGGIAVASNVDAGASTVTDELVFSEP